MTTRAPMSALLHFVRVGAVMSLVGACAWTPEPESNAVDAFVGPGRSPFEDAGGTPAANQGGMDVAGNDGGIDALPDASPSPPESTDAGDASAALCGDADAGVRLDSGTDAGPDAGPDAGTPTDAGPPRLDGTVNTGDGGPGHDAGCEPR